ncbi:uncharacterized protein A4U43_C07F37990 [Asparagus officinalis]|uniref:Uncharacterized protein n=1 Tax=Asparagus officinalis TaxID=4686 RepID=A0A5P1EIC2_ASPOF|nr:uncharacterized protein A4U43_C07F37990 [Asparagus officinalis]
MERQEEERKAAKLHTTSILDLPEVIIMYIISLLPVTSAAKCAAVTKKWLELWRSIPDWTLDYNLFPNVENKNKKFRSFVDKVVYMHQGPGIKSMKIHYVQHDQYDLISLHHTERWIRHLVQKNIVRLDINIHNQAQLPFSLFTCGTITELRLGILFKELPLKGEVLLPNLKILYLEQIKFSSQIQFERLMNGCLVLEDLHMKGCSFFAPDFNHLTFSHPNIKSLNLERCGGIGALKIYIWLPSLSEFRFNGAGLVDQEGVIDLSSVSTAVLDLDDILYTYRCRMSNGIMTSCGSNMSRILATVCHARKLTLSDWCLEENNS